MKTFNILVAVMAIATGASCGSVSKSEADTVVEEMNVYVPMSVPEEEGHFAGYESQMFCYPENNELVEVCPVYYYVSNDTLYTSEKYYYINYFWSSDKDTTMTFSTQVFFDRSQEPNEAGWYANCVVDKNPLYDHTGTHLSAIILRSYDGPLHPSEGLANADAYLYNATKEIARSSDRNVLSPELKKLIPYIK